jgi:hypothetical protein
VSTPTTTSHWLVSLIPMSFCSIAHACLVIRKLQAGPIESESALLLAAERRYVR